MKTNVSYKISRCSCSSGNATYIKEFWDDIHVYTWRVNKPYYGGDIVDFLHQNSAYKHVHFDGIDEYHRRIFILDL